MTLPTGSGKTAIIAAVGAKAADRGVVLVVSPSDALCDQLVDEVGGAVWAKVELEAYGPEPIAKRIKPSDTAAKAKTASGQRLVLVSTMQSIESMHRAESELYKELLERTSVVLVDEGHREPAPTWARALRSLGKPMILFSATPYRNDLRQFNVDGDFSEQLTFHQAVADGTIRNVVLHEPIASGPTATFAASLVAALQSLEDRKKLYEGWKVIVRCKTADSVDRMHNALMRLPWARERGVHSFHDTFTGGGAKTSKVKKIAQGKDRFLVHQYKLTEGIPHPFVWSHLNSRNGRQHSVGRPGDR
jgi:superfamily II DNA or RNA helicase